MNEKFERNRDDEDWEERREGRGKSVPECELDDFMRRLREGGPSHSSYYHYTQWENFAKMMVSVADGDAKGKKVLLLTVASETNDKIEKHWGKNVYLGCFSYSRYEDVAITIHGLKIWGSPWVKPKNKRKDKPEEYKLFERSETDLKKIFGQMPEDVDVLVTHSTPTVEGTYIAGRPEEAMGCDALRDVILEKKPRVCVCGHIHAKEHHPAMLGETVVMNVSRIHGNERYAPAYRPRVFVMKRKEGKFVCEYDATDDMRVARKR